MICVLASIGGASLLAASTAPSGVNRIVVASTSLLLATSVLMGPKSARAWRQCIGAFDSNLRDAGVLALMLFSGVFVLGGLSVRLLTWVSLVTICAAAVEELVFREWLWKRVYSRMKASAIATALHSPIADAVASLAFAAAHFVGRGAWGSLSVDVPTVFLRYFLLGLLFQAIMRALGLAVAVAVHALVNIAILWSIGLAVNRFSVLLGTSLAFVLLWESASVGRRLRA